MKITDLLPRVLPYVKGCSEPLAESYIRDALIEFCRTTRIYRYRSQITTSPLLADPRSYDIGTPVNMNAFFVWSAKMDGYPIEVVSEHEMQDLSDDIAVGDPQKISLTHNHVEVYPTPASNKVIYIEVALYPSHTVDEIGCDELIPYYQAIADGAIGRLMMIPGKEWSNFNMGTGYTAMFHSAMDKARVNVESAKSFKVRTVAYGGI